MAERTAPLAPGPSGNRVVARTADTARAYRALLVAQVRSQTAYRASFLTDLAVSLCFSALDIATVLVLFSVTRGLGGFGFGPVLLMASLANAGFALADAVVGNVERLQAYVRSGLFDAVLLRPRSALGQLVVLDFAPRRLGRFAQGLVFYLIGLGTADIDWNPARVLLAVVDPIAAALYFSAMLVLGATVAFWWIDSGELANSVTYGGKDFATYPVTVFDGWFRRLFAYGLGFAAVAYWPSLVLLDAPDPLGSPPWLRLAGTAVPVLVVAVAAFAWRQGVRHYRSTGS